MPSVTEERSPRARVLVVAPEPFYEDRGTPIAVRQLATALSQLGFEVDLLTYPLGRSVDIPRVRILRAANPLGLRQVPIGFSLRKLLLDAALLPAMAARLARGGYACIHAVEEAAFPAVVLGRRFGVPVIYDMQSSLPEQMAHLRAFRGARAQAVLCRAERWLLSRADSIVASGGLAARVRAAVPGKRPREWRYASQPPAGEDAAPPAVDALRRELGIRAGRPVVLYSGTFEPYQGLPELVAAIPRVRARHPEALFLLVGGEGSRRAEIERRHAGLVRAGALRVCGRQPREAMPRFLALADVAVSPRAWGDNLPLKIFDYMAAGRAIVAADIPAHRAVLDERLALLVPPTAAALAGAISSLLDDPARAAALARSAAAYAAEHCGWLAFLRSVEELYRDAGVVPEAPFRRSGGPLPEALPFPAPPAGRFSGPPRRVSIVIPARDEAPAIGRTVERVLAGAPRGIELEVIVVDDGSRDATAARAALAGARVLRLGLPGHPVGGSPGAARNRGFAASTGDPVVFLDADCTPADGWLAALLAAHDAGEAVVGGSLDQPPGQPLTSRCDHYCGCYHLHPRRAAGPVPNHSPANLSVRRAAFAATRGFAEQPPVADGHEELPWQADLARQDVRIYFEPRAVVQHHGRPGVKHLLARNYRWGYSALESKAATGASRWPWLFRHPRLLLTASAPLALAHTAHTLACWARAGELEPLALLPLVAAARFAYAAGVTVGGMRWLARRQTGARPLRPRWR